MAKGAVERKWIRAEVDEARARALSVAIPIQLRTARLLVARGVHDPELARRYLAPQLSHLPDPSLMKDLDRAANRLADAIANKEPITLYGDYDVDGVTSSTLLAAFLRLHGVEAAVYIPKRLIEGYGLNPDAIESIAASGCRLLITLDCGITAAEEITKANERGLQVIVVDHHRCPPALPPAYAVLNPQQEDCRYPEKVLAAVGVAFNLIIGVRKVLRERGVYASGQEPQLRRLLDLVAMGTIADMVPLTGVNRVLTHFGMMELRHAKRPGVRALMEVSKTRPVRADSGDVGFKLGPRINAAGRLADAAVGVRLLTTEDIGEARRLAESLDSANGNRQRIEAEVFEAAKQIVDSMRELPPAIILADAEWHPGVVGIVCSKLVERYDRPTILIGEGGRGSARTAKGLHLYDAINDCSEHLLKFGGHRAAAGMRIPFDKIGAFREALLARVLRDPEYGHDHQSTLIYDDDLRPEEIDADCYSEIMKLEPFGNGNPEPLFRVPARLKTSKVVGLDHLKLRLEQGERGGLSAIAFKKGEMNRDLVPGCDLDLAAHLELNDFSGIDTLELRVRELRPQLDEP